MRKLQAADLFSFCRLIRDIDLKEEVKNIAKVYEKENAWDMGYELIYTIFEKAISKKTENAIYEFLSGIMEVERGAVAKMDPVELLEHILEIASPEKWKELFTQAAKLMK